MLLNFIQVSLVTGKGPKGRGLIWIETQLFSSAPRSK
jgi:hypothetical protein